MDCIHTYISICIYIHIYVYLMSLIKCFVKKVFMMVLKLFILSQCHALSIDEFHNFGAALIKDCPP